MGGNRDELTRDAAFSPNDICVPVYLDQATVFDMLAFIEDGLYHLQTVTSSTGEEETKQGRISAQLGTSNAFSFLKVGLGGERDKEQLSASREERQRELVYTPVSLFSKLRFKLQSQGLIVDLSKKDGIASLSPGDMVEFQGVLSENPVIAAIQTSIDFDRFIRSGGAPTAIRQEQSASPAHSSHQPLSGQGRKKGASTVTAANQVADSIPPMMRSTLDALKALDERELICRVTSQGPNVPIAVILTRTQFFTDPKIQTVLGGEYRTLGKIVRVVGEPDAPINLVRWTPVGGAPQVYTEQLQAWVTDMRNLGLPIPEGSVFEVPGPAIHVRPIAVFL